MGCVSIPGWLLSRMPAEKNIYIHGLSQKPIKSRHIGVTRAEAPFVCRQPIGLAARTAGRHALSLD